MSVYNLYFCFFFSSLSLVFSDEDYFQSRACCTFKGHDYEDMEFIILLMFNKNIMMEFNSTRGNWTGFSASSIEVAKSYNNPVDNIVREIQKKKLCFDNLEALKEYDKIAFTPTIKLKYVKQSGGSHPAMLVCSAFDFYPKQIKMTWLHNQQQVTESVSYSEVMPDGKWYYQSHSYLEYTPTTGEKITCVVEHITLSKPEYVVWDSSLPETEWNKIVVGLSGLLIGFVAVISGLIYYKKKSAGYITLCNRQVLDPVQHIPAEEAT